MTTILAERTYRGAAAAAGPLLFLERKANVGLNARVEVLGHDGRSRIGRVSAVEEQTLVIEVLESTLGLGVRAMDLLAELPRDLRLDVHGQFSYLPTETTLKASAADLVGDYAAGGTIWNVGATLTMGF